MKTLKAVTNLGKSILFHLFYAPACLMYYAFCKLHGEEGNEFWKNMKPNIFNIISSIGWWALIVVVLIGLILAGLTRSIPIDG